jgi:DNA-binding MarR family transcriptional regulator
MAVNYREQGIPGVELMVAMTTILRAQQVIVARVTDVLRPLGLSFSRYEALSLLHFSPDGTLPLAKTSERLLLHPSSVTGTIDRLARDGLVERLPHPTDRRVTLARITPAGDRLAVQAIRVVAEADFGLAGMEEDEIQQVTKTLFPLRQAAFEYQRGDVAETGPRS